MICTETASKWQDMLSTVPVPFVYSCPSTSENFWIEKPSFVNSGFTMLPPISVNDLRWSTSAAKPKTSKNSPSGLFGAGSAHDHHRHCRPTKLRIFSEIILHNLWPFRRYSWRGRRIPHRPLVGRPNEMQRFWGGIVRFQGVQMNYACR